MKRYIIGRTDKADFPKLKLKNLDVKIDSGAYTSSIHCHHIEEIEKNGKKAVCFALLDPGHKKYNGRRFIIYDFSKRRVKNSFGKSQMRFVIKTTIILFNKKFPIELSLTERKKMKYPVLLGRKLLNRQFIIDSSKHNLSFKQKKR